jgi:glycosyltransferase involved in cell wall biosynthesis
MYASNLWRIFHSEAGSGLQTKVLLPETEAFRDIRNSAADAAVAVRPPSLLRSQKATKLWWEQRGLLHAAQLAGADLIHISHFAAPVRRNRPIVVTIHDVIPYVFPAYRSSTSMRLYLKLISRATRNAEMILTDSECSRRDIVRYLGIDRERIVVVPLAVDEQFRPLHDQRSDEAIREQFNLPGPVIFNVGGLDVRKNVESLIQAFAQALPELDPNTRLVIAGGAHTSNTRLYPPLDGLISELGIKQQVVLTGRISEADKLRLYNVADLYVFASLYEGFGLSPLEAMACGTPVICSNRSSLPEVVGDAGILVDPTPEKIARSIATVMNDEYLRRKLSAQGLEQARRFSWERTAEMTRDVYRHVLNNL